MDRRLEELRVLHGERLLARWPFSVPRRLYLCLQTKPNRESVALIREAGEGMVLAYVYGEEGDGEGDEAPAGAVDEVFAHQILA